MLKSRLTFPLKLNFKMNKFLRLAILIIGTISLGSAHFEAKSQSEPLKLTQNLNKQTWIVLNQKSGFSIALDSIKLGNNNDFIVSPKKTEVYFAQVSEATLTQFIKLNPNNANAYFYRGFIRIQERNYRGAEADYIQVIRLKPNDADAYSNRGRIREELKNYQGAEVDYTQVIRLKPNDADAYSNRGRIREELKNYQGAEADYTQLIRLKPNEGYVYNNRGLIRKQLKNYKGAEADFTQATKLDSENVDAYNNRSIVRKALKNYQGAEADLQVAARLYRQQNNAGSRITEADAYIHRVIVYTNINNLSSFPTTEADYTQAIKLNPNDAEAYFQRGFLRTKAKNYQSAEADFTQVIKLTPTAADAYSNRGLIRKELKNYKGAEADFTQAIELFPDEANVYINRGLLRLELKKYKGAEADYTQVIRLSPHPRTSYQIVKELDALLTKAGIEPPYIFVGDSYGSYNVRLYAHLFPQRVTGIVLTDALHETEMLKMSMTLQALKLFFLSGFIMSTIGSILGIIRLLKVCGVFELLKPQLRQCPQNSLNWVKRSFCRPKHWITMSREMINLDVSSRQVSVAKHSGTLPMISIKASSFFKPSFWTIFIPLQGINQLRNKMHLQLGNLSTNCLQVSANKSSHFVWVDQPELIIDAVIAIVAQSSKSKDKPSLGR